MNKTAKSVASLIVGTMALCFPAFAPGPAVAHTGINVWSATPSTTQAGGHPDVDLHVRWDNRVYKEGNPVNPSPNVGCDCQDVDRITIDFPTGFIGNPHAIATCTLLEFGTRKCPPEAQVGIATVGAGQFPLYNVEPHPGQAGLLGFLAPVIATPIFIDLNARTDSDYGLRSVSDGNNHLLPFRGTDIYLWGVPGDPAHDVNRFPQPQPGGFGCFAEYPEPCGPPVKFNGEVKPYLENPTSCGTPLKAGLNLLYYDFTNVQADTGWSQTTGCDILSFDPSLTAKPTTTQADTASGLDVNLTVPQSQNPVTPSPSEIRAATITLPQGFSINSNAADGKVACTRTQGSFGTVNAAGCPEHAKIGTVELDSSALPGPIDGAIYLGQPQPGERYPIFLTADGFSTHVKLAGSVSPDSTTGQITVSFNDLPQSPFQGFNMHFFGSERGLLATPTQCGSYSVASEFVPWDSMLPNHTSTSIFEIDSGPNGRPCPSGPRPFSPSADAGSSDNTAGVRSPFFLEVQRADGDQNLAGLGVRTPPGLLASLVGTSFCSNASLLKLSAGYTGVAERQIPSCPASSRIGTAIAGVGAGSRPLHVTGSVYLAGPYKGAPLSLAAVVPAVAGPYDLGNVAVRVALHVDPITAQVTADSDPLPQILEGIPLRLRSIRVNLDRRGFMLNPTDCDPNAVRVTVLGDEAAVFQQDLPYQVANCADLAYRPKVALRLGGGLNRRGHPSIRVVINAKVGEANSRSVTVTVPKGELLDNSHIGTVCTRVAFAQAACPAASVLGQAEVTTPLLDQPLKGTVYLRSSDQDLPDIALDLKGQFDIQAIGHIDSVKGRLRAKFDSIPDAPLSRVVVDLVGGAKGLLVNSESLCLRSKAATVGMVAQSGRAFTAHPRLQVACGAKARAKAHRHTEGRG